jgi:single-stranded-DNA-specific exonuclease
MSMWNAQKVDVKSNEVLSRALGISQLQATLLMGRGIRTVEQATAFLYSSIEQFHNPFLFKEMENAVSVLHESITRGERILVHGDYDADGVCGTALLYEALEKLGADVHYFVPDRARDGYGLAMRVMERGISAGLKMVVSVDCGSSDREVVSYLAGKGVKVIVTDHHETRERIPEATAFINPKLPGESYPFTELAGAGVAFKLLQGLERMMGINLTLDRLLDLAAIGTLGDYTALQDENRVIVKLGMELLKEWKRPGLRALREESGLSKDGFTARQLCFTLVPRLNSPGRIGSARDVVNLLLTGDDAEASRIAEEIELKNKQRQAHDSQVTEEACYLADIIIKRAEPNALVFSSSSWHEGVVGIAAARLAERYNIPSILIAVRDGIGKGSARSAGMVNIKEVLERCSECLNEYGGHKEAGGFSILEENIPDFQRLAEKAVEELAISGGDSGSLIYDVEIRLNDCDLELVSFIERLSPFGPGNPEPTFLLKGLTVLPGSRLVGDGHLKLSAKDADSSQRNLIGFSFGRTWSPDDIIGRSLDVLIHLRRNHYMGKVETQLQITAIRVAEDSVQA